MQKHKGGVLEKGAVPLPWAIVTLWGSLPCEQVENVGLRPGSPRETGKEALASLLEPPLHLPVAARLAEPTPCQQVIIRWQPCVRPYARCWVQGYSKGHGSFS